MLSYFRKHNFLALFILPLILYSTVCEATDFTKIKEEAEKEDQETAITIIENQEIPLWLEKHYQRIFTWNYTSSIVMFCLVVMVVISGLIFSYFQFKTSLVRSNEISKNIYLSKNLDLEKKSERPHVFFDTTEFKLDKDGIKISSSVIGLITLVISLAFLYLYLAYVHPIKVIELNSEPIINSDETLID